MNQPNYAIAEAARKAHVKAEGKKTHTVSKGTISLAGNMNKRSTDNQKPADNTMPEAAEKAMSAAAQALHNAETKPSNVEQFGADLTRIVIRQGLRGELYVFFVDSEKREEGTIELFDVAAYKRSGKADKEVVNVGFYKQATKPVETNDAKDDAIKTVTKAFNINRVIPRSRLVKEGSIPRNDDGKSNNVDLDAWKEKLISAITKAIREA